MAWLRESDVIVAECTCPSLGVGYELAYAEAKGKRRPLRHRMDDDRRRDRSVDIVYKLDVSTTLDMTVCCQAQDKCPPPSHKDGYGNTDFLSA